jgi:serine/threonine protein phosphatase PrpC
VKQQVNQARKLNPLISKNNNKLFQSWDNKKKLVSYIPSFNKTNTFYDLNNEGCGSSYVTTQNNQQSNQQLNSQRNSEKRFTHLQHMPSSQKINVHLIKQQLTPIIAKDSQHNSDNQLYTRNQSKSNNISPKVELLSSDNLFYTSHHINDQEEGLRPSLNNLLLNKSEKPINKFLPKIEITKENKLKKLNSLNMVGIKEENDENDLYLGAGKLHEIKAGGNKSIGFGSQINTQINNTQMNNPKNSARKISLNLKKNSGDQKDPLSTMIDEDSQLGKAISHKFSDRSKEGKNYGISKTNQDAILAIDNILGLDFGMFSVFDGHGINGHYISESIKSSFIKYFTRSELYYIPRGCSNLTTGLPSLKSFTSEIEVHRRLSFNNYELVKKAFSLIDNEIQHSSFDVDFSGSTACMCFLIGGKFFCANVGDSRAIFVHGKGNDIVEMSRDHKPDDPLERERIRKSGGVVQKIQEYGIELGPHRVWVSGQNYPGLAMSRSLGDFIGKKVGITAEPEIIEIDLNKESKFAVIASDGVWEFLSNERVVELVYKYYQNKDLNGAVNTLIDESTTKWNMVLFLLTL